MVSKLFRAYRLYNLVIALLVGIDIFVVSKLFRAYRLYNEESVCILYNVILVSKLFRAYRLYNELIVNLEKDGLTSFKALSSLQVI